MKVALGSLNAIPIPVPIGRWPTPISYPGWTGTGFCMRTVTAAVLAAGLASASPAVALAQTFPAQIDLSALNGVDGFALDGAGEFENSGFRVSTAGDLNGDGVSDIVIAASFTSYVVFGTDRGFPARSSLSTLDGTDGFAIPFTGGEVSGAGDVNGDGIDDLLLSASFNASYVVFGTTEGFPSVFDVALLDGTNGFAVNFAEIDVSGAGDVNGDGFDDIIIGHSQEFTTLAGRAYVVFGAAGGFPALVDVGTLDGSNGFVLQGADILSSFGFTVSGAGDFNGDGIDDIIVGGGIPANHPSGHAFVIFGTTEGFPPVFSVANLNGSNGVRIAGAVAEGDHYVSDAGDVNGDGIGDVIIGNPFAPGPNGEPQTGQAFVVFGTAGAVPAEISLSALDGATGFVLNGFDPFGGAGIAVSGAGDVNGDGIGDVIVGALQASPNGLAQAGQSYVVFGSDHGFPAQFTLSALDGTNGFALNGGTEGDASGFSVSDAGDVNGDGVEDVMVGAPQASPDGLFFAGQTYVVYGRRPEPALTVSGVCPGEVALTYTKATPNGAILWFHAASQGSFVIPLVQCTGTVIDLASPLPFAPSLADETGTAVRTVTTPPPACGRFVQAIDVATCNTSNVVQLP